METLLFVPIGENGARPFGMNACERARRLAANAGFECADEAQEGRAALVASLAYAWDPAWRRAAVWWWWAAAWRVPASSLPT